MTYLPWNGVCGVNPTVGVEDIFWDVFCVNAVYRISDVPEKKTWGVLFASYFEQLTVEWWLWGRRRGGRWLLLSSAVEILSCRSWPEKDSLNPRFHTDDLPTDCDLVRPLRPRKMSSIVIHRLPPFFNSRPLGKYSLTAALSENILSQPSSRKSAWRYSLIDLDFTRAISFLPRNYLAEVSITPQFILIVHFSILPLSSPPPMPSPPPNTRLPLRICKAKK